MAARTLDRKGTKKMRALALAASLAALSLATVDPASAWVSYNRSGSWTSPSGATRTWSSSGTAGGAHWGYGYGYHPCCSTYHYGYSGAAVAGAAVAGAAVGAVAGAAVASAARPTTVVVAPAYGATYAALPGGCTMITPSGATYYACGGVYYRPYYGPSGVVYQVVPAP